MSQTTTKRLFTVLALSGFVLAGPAILADIEPLNLDTGQAQAGKGNSNGNGNSGNSGNSGGGNSSAGGGGHGNGNSSVAPGSSNRGGRSLSASSNAATTPDGKPQGFLELLFSGFAGKSQATAKGTSHGTPKAAVRKYVVKNGLSQGEVARQLKSWNSINRNPRAFLNNLDNPASLPGLQAAYILQNGVAQDALIAFTGLGGVVGNEPNAEDLGLAVQAVDAQAVLDAQVLLASGLDPEIDAVQIAELEAIVSGFAIEYPDADALAVVTEFGLANGGVAPQVIIDQYNAWQIYAAAEETAQADFAAASVSYAGPYDEDLAAVRERVDIIVEDQNLLEVLTAG